MNTGVIVAVDRDTTAEGAQRIAEQLAENFPGVNFTVVAGCTSSVAFTYTPPSPALPHHREAS